MRIRMLLLTALAGLTAACQTVQSTNKSAVDYNRAFAAARDEITLLNVLRAAARQPLQFSTISSVQGGVRSGASLRVPFVNLIDGGSNAISPEVTISARNPTVSITPLATREFIQGISRPLSPGVIDDLLVQGWPLDLVLGLTIGGVVCAEGAPKLNFGDDAAVDERFMAMFRKVNDFGFELGSPAPYARLRMSGAEALAAIRAGAGEQRRIASVASPPDPNGSGDVIVDLVTPGQPSIKGIDYREVCADAASAPRHTPEKALVPAEGRRGGVLMRSVIGIFQYLGKAQAAAAMHYGAGCREESGGEDDLPRLFRVETLCPGEAVPTRPVVSTEFNGRRFFIRRASESRKNDRTLETLSLLIYLVDLQTSETAVKSSVPFIAITQP